MVLLEEKTQRRNIKAEQGQGRQALGCIGLRGKDGEMEIGCDLKRYVLLQDTLFVASGLDEARTRLHSLLKPGTKCRLNIHIYRSNQVLLPALGM